MVCFSPTRLSKWVIPLSSRSWGSVSLRVSATAVRVLWLIRTASVGLWRSLILPATLRRSWPMRDYGRPLTPKFKFPGKLPPPPETVPVLTDGKFTTRITASRAGVLLVKFVTWTGRLLVQHTFSWADWYVLSSEARRRTYMDFFVRPGTKTDANAPVGGPVTDPLMWVNCPTLAAYLCSDHWPDGECRQKSTLIVFWEDGQYKACLSEKDTLMTLWAASKAFDDIPGALEARLTEPTPDWRKQRPFKKRT